MNVLVDTSVWVAHFKQHNAHLAALLEYGRVICHDYVVAEVACGTPPDRHNLVDLLGELASAPIATQEELLALIEQRRLYGRGCGFVDLSLLAAALLQEGTTIWTMDKRFKNIAVELKLAYRPTLNS